MKDENCLFCKIIAGEIPSKKIFESENTFAFLDIFPVSKGHTVVVPKTHCYNLLDAGDEIIGPFFKDLKKVAALVHEKLGSEESGFNIVQNNFPAAGQVIPHLHYHIIPRMKGDGLVKLKIAKNQASNEELDSVLSEII